MLIKKQQRFKSLISIIILSAAGIPALIVAIILITQLGDNNRTQVEDKIELKARMLSQQIEHKLELLTTNIDQLAHDQNIILATDNGVFGNAARNQMSVLLEHNSIVDFIQIYDIYNWPAESFPEQYSLMELTPVLETLTSIIKHKNFSSQVFMFYHKGINNVVNEYFNKTIYSEDQYIVVTAPLIKNTEGDPNQQQINGVILALVPISKFLKEMNLTDSQLVSLELEKKSTIAKQSNLPKYSKWMIKSWPVQIGQNTISLNYGEPLSIVTKPINRAILSFTLIVTIILASCVIFVIWITKRLSTPFNQMHELVTSYTQGDFDVSMPEIRYMEFRELADLLSNMAHTIFQNKEELEHKVKIRTNDLAKSNEELKLTLDKLNAMQEHLIESEKMSLLGKLVAGVAHEISTPIGISVTAISTLETYTDTLFEFVDSGKLTRNAMSDYIAKTSQLIPILLNNLNRAAELINNFKEVAVDQSSEDKRRFNLHDYIYEVLNSLQPQLKRYQISIEVNCDKNILMNSFPGAFAQIITNFMMNSMSHGFTQKQQHNISINAQIIQDQLEFVYSDDGCGIPQENINNIFDPFYTTKRNDGGSGLGLSIVRSIVHQKLQGKIKVIDTQQKGVKLVIFIPLTENIISAKKMTVNMN
ncbi:MAG: hypothetical protein COB35_10420 [Gammaproteobacteria bacterium]|nr:MAG: hypothetical protein COB35_10420 [Gammaproteobacteria bacterium]